MTYKPKYALYLEMTNETRGAQLILIPPYFNVLMEKTTDVIMLGRKISKKHPRRSWQTYKTSYPYDSTGAPTIDTATAMQEATPLLQDINNLLIGYAVAGWTLTKHPLAVEMSYDDECDVLDNNTPAALVRRIVRARQEAGFPKTVWPSEEETPVSLGWTTPEPEAATPATPTETLTSTGDGMFSGYDPVSELQKILDSLEVTEEEMKLRWQTPDKS